MKRPASPPGFAALCSLTTDAVSLLAAACLPLLLMSAALSAAAAAEANAVQAGTAAEPTDIVLFEHPTADGLPRFTTLLGPFDADDMRAMLPKMTGFVIHSKSGLLVLKRQTEPHRFESFTHGMEQDILCELPFDRDYADLKASLTATELPQLAAQTCRAWLATQSLQVFFHHTSLLRKLTYLSPHFRKAYGDAAMAQAATEREPYRRLCLGIVAFQTSGYAGFEAYEKDWAEASHLRRQTLAAAHPGVPEDLLTYGPFMVFTSLAPHVQADNFEKLWRLMRSQNGDLKEQLLSSLTVNPFLRPKNPLPRQYLINKTEELHTLLRREADPIAYAAFTGLQIAHERRYTSHRIDTLDDFKKYKASIKANIQASLSKPAP